jgi:hypothetical protein
MRDRAGSFTFLASALALAFAAGQAACSGDAPTVSGRTDNLLRFTVSNQLEAPVTIVVDDTVRLILLNGMSGGVAIEPTAQWLTWTSAKPTDTSGTPIPDDIGSVQVRVAGLSGHMLEITNVINDTTYVTLQFFNRTSEQVSIGVYEGSTVSCAGLLWAATQMAPGFTKIGYYRLLPATEIRAYRGSQCTGPYATWKASQLVPFAPKSGLVTLTLDTAP